MVCFKNYKKVVLAIVLTLTIIVAMLSPSGAVAFAQDSAGYSNVLDDLKKDSTFDVNNYPVDSTDYSLKIIQLAESTDKELIVYVYQPCGIQTMRASSINISTTAATNITPKNYTLKFANSSGVFFKYIVEGITVSNAEARYYGVTSIYRPFNKEYGDKEPGFDNTVTEVPFNVSKEYRFSTINGKPVTATVDIETIEITDKFVGFVRYDDGYKFHESACDSHFVAFDTDKPIDRLVEADVAWVQREQIHEIDGTYWKPYFGEIKNEQRTLSEDDDTVHYKGGGISAASYEWERIQRIDEFISSVDLEKNVYHGAVLDVNVVSKITEEGKQALKNKKWVLRFVDTEYDVQYREAVVSGIKYWGHIEKSTLVGEVTILRLKFITDGVTYNLGVIDNKQTGSDKPINDTEYHVTVSNGLKSFWNHFLEALKIIGIVFGAIIGIVLLFFVVRFVFKITAPLREIAKERRKEKRDEKKQSDRKEHERHGQK